VGVALAEAAAEGPAVARPGQFGGGRGLTSVLIFLNRTYASDGAGLRITNLPGVGDPAAWIENPAPWRPSGNTPGR